MTVTVQVEIEKVTINILGEDRAALRAMIDEALQIFGVHLMTTADERLDSLKAAIDTATDAIGASLTGIAGDIAALKASAGALTPDQAAKYDAIEARVAAAAAAAQALDAEN